VCKEKLTQKRIVLHEINKTKGKQKEKIGFCIFYCFVNIYTDRLSLYYIFYPTEFFHLAGSLVYPHSLRLLFLFALMNTSVRAMLSVSRW
jgi:hypothetical protein